jgi:hypothetical protein
MKDNSSAASINIDIPYQKNRQYIGQLSTDPGNNIWYISQNKVHQQFFDMGC